MTVSGLVRNYLGNNVYMTEKTYESLFGDYEPNGVFLKLSEECSDEIAYADDLGGKEGIVSYTSKQELSDEFSDAFTLINMVVYIVIIMAAALAFGTTHLSLYQLTIEPGTRFATMVSRGDFTPADADHAADLFDATRAMTTAHGLPAYEVSNHATPGAESRQ